MPRRLPAPDLLTPAELARLAERAAAQTEHVRLALFTAREQARLVFLRWLYSMGRVEP